MGICKDGKAAADAAAATASDVRGGALLRSQARHGVEPTARWKILATVIVLTALAAAAVIVAAKAEVGRSRGDTDLRRENDALRHEVAALRLENAALLERLHSAQQQPWLPNGASERRLVADPGPRHLGHKDSNSQSPTSRHLGSRQLSEVWFQQPRQDVAQVALSHIKQTVPAVAKATAALGEKDVEDIFLYLDQDQDGFLSPTEFYAGCIGLRTWASNTTEHRTPSTPWLPAAAAATAALTELDAWEVFRLLDKNNDRQISKEEFMQGCVLLRSFSKAQEAATQDALSHGKSHLAANIGSSARIYQLSALLAIVLLLVFEFYTRHLQVDSAEQFARQSEVFEASDRRLGFDAPSVWTLMKPYWCSKESRRGWFLLFFLVALDVASIFVSEQISLVTSMFWSAAQYQDAGAFLNLLKGSPCLFVLSVVVGSYYDYVRKMIVIEWRTSMTAHFQQTWLQNNAFYTMRVNERVGKVIDNPDQRIETDIDDFTTNFIDLSMGLFDAFGQLLVFVPLLWQLSPRHMFGVEGLEVPGWLCYLTLAYSLSGNFFTHVVGSQLIRQNYYLQRSTADFRSGLIRVREGAEAIALFEASDLEDRRLKTLFSHIRYIVYQSMRTNLYLSLFQSLFSFASDFFPLYVLAPSFFKGHLTLGDLTQARYAQGSVIGALGWFMNSYWTLTQFRATTSRLIEFITVAEEANVHGIASWDHGFRKVLVSGGAKTSAPSPGLAFAGTVNLPGGKQLHTDVEVEVLHGQWVMLTGQSGVGKTTLLRALVGLWPFGLGKVERPKDAVMVPADSSARLLKDATLREVICYPQPSGTFPDVTIEAALRKVGLSRLLEETIPVASADSSEQFNEPEALLLDFEVVNSCSGTFGISCSFPCKTGESDLLATGNGPLDQRADWGLLLSSGERQRLEFAFLLCARPHLVMLDEPTAHLPSSAALELLRALREGMPPTSMVLTVSHDKALGQCHDRELHVSRNGVETVQDSSAGVQRPRQVSDATDVTWQTDRRFDWSPASTEEAAHPALPSLLDSPGRGPRGPPYRQRSSSH